MRESMALIHGIISEFNAIVEIITCFINHIFFRPLRHRLRPALGRVMILLAIKK